MKCQKAQQQLPNCLAKAETSVILLPVAQHESGTRKTISWSVTVYSKNLPSQCNLTAQI